MLVTKRGIYMDLLFKENLDNLVHKAKTANYDIVGLSDGKEGAGKTEGTSQTCYYLDEERFNIDSVYFNGYDLIEEVNRCAETGTKFKSLMLDESRESLSSERSMSKINHRIKNVLSRSRKLNLFVFIILPTFMELDKNIAVWRSRFLVHYHTDSFLNRGFAKVYNEDAKKTLYFHGRKNYYSYAYPAPTMRINFSIEYQKHHRPILDPVAYEKKANEAITREVENGEISKADERAIKYKVFKNWTGHPKGQLMNRTELAAVLDVDRQTITRWFAKLKEDFGGVSDEGKGVHESMLEAKKLL